MSLSVILMSALVVIVIAIGAALAVKKGKVESGIEEIWPFYAKKPLSTPEQVLYFRLVNALPRHVVLAQVQLSRVLGVKKGHAAQAWNNRINRMSVDFVICSKDATVVAVIELDDASHDRADRKLADAKKDRALSAAGIVIHRYQVKSLPDDRAIRSLINAATRHEAVESIIKVV